MLIDTENIASDKDYTALVPTLLAGDKVIMFFTKNTRKTNFSILEFIAGAARKGAFIDAIHCSCGIESELDIQLATYLGYLAPTLKADDSLIVYSNDKGYDSVIRFWNNFGFNVMRCMSNTTGTNRKGNKTPIIVPLTNDGDASITAEDSETEIAAKKPKQSEPKPKTKQKPVQRPPLSPTGNNPELCKQFYQQEIEKLNLDENITERLVIALFESINQSPSKKLPYLHNELVQMFGMEETGRIYPKLKKVFQDVDKNGPHPTWTMVQCRRIYDEELQKCGVKTQHIFTVMNAMDTALKTYKKSGEREKRTCSIIRQTYHGGKNNNKINAEIGKMRPYLKKIFSDGPRYIY